MGVRLGSATLWDWICGRKNAIILGPELTRVFKVLDPEVQTRLLALWVRDLRNDQIGKR